MCSVFPSLFRWKWHIEQRKSHFLLAASQILSDAEVNLIASDCTNLLASHCRFAARPIEAMLIAISATTPERRANESGILLTIEGTVPEVPTLVLT
jgi:hypothetical protein